MGYQEGRKLRAIRSSLTVSAVARGGSGQGQGLELPLATAPGLGLLAAGGGAGGSPSPQRSAGAGLTGCSGLLLRWPAELLSPWEAGRLSALPRHPLRKPASGDVVPGPQGWLCNSMALTRTGCY